VLLDTHALLWWGFEHPRLSRRARTTIGDAETTVFVSAATAWEIAIKARLGKLPGAQRFAAGVGEYLAEQGFVGLDITIAHAQRAGALPAVHRDPFDRMLVAQAQAENLTLVSNEGVFDHYGVARLW
jgi:PIN domain nuclease of toxin-antitoxin system